MMVRIEESSRFLFLDRAEQVGSKGGQALTEKAGPGVGMLEVDGLGMTPPWQTP
jgi:hypothetical protein